MTIAGSLGAALGTSSLAGNTGLLTGNAEADALKRRFSALIDGVSAGLDTPRENPVSSTSASGSTPGTASGPAALRAAGLDTRLPGDYISSMLSDDEAARADTAVRGAARNAGQDGRIDRSSKLYEQSMELENFFVKIMLSTMRSTVQKSGLAGEDSFASKMYEDMLYDEYSRALTKNAGFGLADQVYLQLSSGGIEA